MTVLALMFYSCMGEVFRHSNARAWMISPFGALLADPSGEAWPPSGKSRPAARGDKLFELTQFPSGELGSPFGLCPFKLLNMPNPSG